MLPLCLALVALQSSDKEKNQSLSQALAQSNARLIIMQNNNSNVCDCSIIAGATNMNMETLMNLFGGLGTGSLAVPNRSNGCYSFSFVFIYTFSFALHSFHSIILSVPPEELYATQLTQLQEMGFFDTQENIRALIATAGNVHAAVERLLGSPGL